MTFDNYASRSSEVLETFIIFHLVFLGKRRHPDQIVLALLLIGLAIIEVVWCSLNF